MKQNKGVTMLVLVITIIVLVIIAGISIGKGNNIIKRSQLENFKTNMLLIKVKAKQYVENANFKLGTNPTPEEKASRIEDAKKEFLGEQIIDGNIFSGNINKTNEDIAKDISNNIFYYKVSTDNLVEMGLSNVSSDEKNGWYIIKYDVENIDIEIYNTKGFENGENRYYTLTDIQDLNL